MRKVRLLNDGTAVDAETGAAVDLSSVQEMIETVVEAEPAVTDNGELTRWTAWHAGFSTASHYS